ncbi:MAG: PadR family transcriptional regulator [Bacteroidales bacterium]|nr:PadR family transcriptional regulator [Bacteroidales bacterium]
MEKAESTIAQMRKGVLEMSVLAAINGNEAYASDILERLKLAHLIVVEGNLLPHSYQAQKEGSLSYRWEESTSGPPRKYYSVTPAGHEFLNELNKGWNELVAAVSLLLSDTNNSKPTNNN